MNVAALRPAGNGISWWQDPKMVSLVKRTAARDCNQDEFDEFVAVARELNLSPLRKQLYAFVFSKENADRRNMSLVVGIDGGRSIAARTGNYRPDDQKPEWVFKEELKNPLSNPHGIETCTVGVYHRPTRSDPFERIVHTVYWEEFAPLVKAGGDDDYEMVETGETWPNGNPKKRKRLKAGATVTLRLDPKKEQWTRAGRNMIAKCAEMGALRKGWPEDLSRVVVEEETHRSQVLEGVDYTDLTPSEMAAKADTDARIERIGGPALFATFDDSGTLERVPYGQFADRMLAATEKLAPAAVAALVDRNREALKEFWAHSKNDALELKKILETRSGVTGATAAQGDVPAKAASPQPGEQDTGRGGPANSTPAREALPKLTGLLAERHRDNLVKQIAQLETPGDLLGWARDGDAEIARLPDAMAEFVRGEFNARQNTIKGMHK